MVERMVRIHEVRGSIPLISTTKFRLFIVNKRNFWLLCYCAKNQIVSSSVLCNKKLRT